MTKKHRNHAVKGVNSIEKLEQSLAIRCKTADDVSTTSKITPRRERHVTAMVARKSKLSRYVLVA